MFYITGLLESSIAVAFNFFRDSDYKEMAETIYQANKQYFPIYSAGDRFPPHSVIYIPTDRITAEQAAQVIMHLNSLAVDSRIKLKNIVQSGLLYDHLATMQLIQIANQSRSVVKKEKGSAESYTPGVMAFTGTAAREGGEYFADHAGEKLKDFIESIKKLDQIQKEAHESGANLSSNEVKEVTKDTVDAMNKAKESLKSRMLARAKSISKVTTLTDQEEIFSVAPADMEILEGLAKYAKYLGKGLFWSGLIMGGYDVIKSGADGEDGFVKASGVGVELGSGAVLGGLITSVVDIAAVVLGYTPEGWVVILVSAAAVGVAAALGSKAAQKSGEELGAEIERRFKFALEGSGKRNGLSKPFYNDTLAFMNIY